MKKRRADERLLEELNLESLALARALIMEGRAFAGERKLKSPGEMVSDKETMRVRGALDPYVSRGAHKLKKALELFDLDVRGETCVDVGASTGGFTDVLLRAGAKHVYAVDVGYNLLDYRLRADDRVTVMERVNARFLRPEDFPQRPSFGATDVSFISLEAVLPAALAALDGANRRFVALVKPQFEAGREKVGKKGVVRDPAVHLEVLEHFLEHAKESRFTVLGLTYSPIRGPEGNIEYLGYLSRAEEEPPVHDLKALVEASHAVLEEKKGENDA